MKISDYKKSLLFVPTEYRREMQDMQRFYSVNNEKMIAPEQDILTFYLANHLFTLIEQKVGNRVLSEDEEYMCESLLDDQIAVFKRVFTYLMLISVGETRHGKTAYKSSEIKEKFGETTWQWVSAIDHKNRAGARDEYVSKHRDIVTDMDYCSWCFINCFSGGSFGGKKWKDIVDKCVQLLAGKISPFTMTDVSWAMVHNNGTIFNKSTIYHNTTDYTGMVQLLDMQRAGAIPAYISHWNQYQGMTGFRCHAKPTAIHHGMLSDAMTLFELTGVTKLVSFQDIGEAGAVSQLFKSAMPKKPTKAVAASEESMSMEPSGETFEIGNHGYAKMERSE